MLKTFEEYLTTNEGFKKKIYKFLRKAKKIGLNDIDRIDLPFSDNAYYILPHKLSPDKYTDSGYLDTDYDSYDDGKLYREIISPITSLRLLKYIKTNIFPNTNPNLCDMGCGIGSFAYFAEKLGYNVTGIEGQVALKKFHKELGINVIYGDFFKIDMSILKNMDVIYLYRPISDFELSNKLMDLIYKNTKKEVVIVYRFAHFYKKEVTQIWKYRYVGDDLSILTKR